MANQITIDIGAAANDGTGDPLRTAFNYVNNNFSNVWNTGLPNSNVQFSDNRILTVNTNANLVLAPNGIGIVQSNVDIIPSINRGQSLGSASKKWNSVNTYYVNADSANIGSFGNLTIAVANLHITGGSNGYVLQTDGAGNLTWTAQTGGSGNGTPSGANTQVQYNNAGSFGGSAAFTFDRTSNVLTVAGNISAGNVFTTNTITAHDAYISTGTFTGDENTGDGALYVGAPTFTSLGTDIMAQFTGNVTNYAQINLQNWSNAATASGDYILTADNGNDSTHFLDIGITSSTWDGSLNNVLSGLVPNNGYLYVQDGNLTLGTRAGNVSYSWNFDTTGNLTVAGNVIPTGNNAQSLGNATRQWNDLWLSNATIYMNSVPISLAAGNILTVNGADVVTTAANGESSIGNLNILGTTIEITAGAPETLINISPDVEGWAYLQLPNDATANSANTRLHNDAGNVEIATGNFSTGSTSYQWYFNNTGSLMLPGNAAANNASISSIENGAIVKLNSQANGYVGMTGFGSAGNNVAAITAVGLDGETDRVIVSVYNPNIDDGEAWTFNNAGDFTTASGNIFFGTNIGGPVIVPSGSAVKIAADRSDLTTGYVNVTSNGITIDALGGSTADITLRAADDIILQGGDKTSAPGQRGGDINIDAGQGGPDNGVNAGDGGDVAIQGGLGGEILEGGSGDGGDVTLLGGKGSTANVVNLLSAGRGGLVVIQGGEGGENAGNISLSERGGNVDIYGGQGSFDFANTLPSGLPGHVNLYGGNWGFVNAPSGNIYLNTYDGTNFKTLTYDTAGNVTMAAGGSLNFVGSSSGIVQSPNNDLIITVQDDNNDDWALYNRITDTGTILGETRLRRGEFQINFPGVAKDFNFNDSGILGLPGDIALNTQGGDISLYAIDDGDSGSAELKTISYAGGTLGSNVRVTQNAATISTNNAAYTWTFDNTGNLTVPGNTIVSTANATGGLGGKNISITAGASDAVTWNSNSGGNINITGGYGSFGDGGGGPGGNVNITSGGSSDSHAGNVAINSGANTWNFDYNGTLTLPNGDAAIVPDLSGTTSFQGAANTGVVMTSSGNAGSVTTSWVDRTTDLANARTASMTLNSAGTANAQIQVADLSSNTISNWTFESNGTLTAPGNISTTGNITGNTAGYAIGYRDIPQVSFTGNTTIATTDAGKHYYSTQSSNYILTIANNASQGFQVGASITVVNQGTGTITIAQGSGVTLYLAGNVTSGNRSLATFGMATLIKVATDTWFINGAGVS